MNQFLLALAWCFAITVGGSFSNEVSAQDFPSKPIRIVNGYGAGGPGDVISRVIAPEMARILGQPVITEARPGAAAMIAVESVARGSPADGYTLMLNTRPQIYQLLFKNLRFDPLSDMTPVASIGDVVGLLVSPAAAPWNSYGEMVAYAKANPGKVNFGTHGRDHVTFVYAALKLKENIDIVDIPYKDGGPGNRMAILANEIQLAILPEFNVTADGNKVKAIAITGDRRRDNFPDVPTFKELGIQGMRGYWFDLEVRSDTPRATIEKLAAAAQTALRVPAIKQALANLGVYVGDTSRETAISRIAEEARINTELARAAGIKPE